MKRSNIILFVVLGLMLIPWLGESLFNSKGEPREAIVAVSMLDSGNWILPESYGQDIPYKPPMLAWLISICSLLLNGGHVSEFTSRLPSALAAIMLLIGGYRLLRTRYDRTFSWLVTIITLTSVEFFRASIACRVDMVLTAAMVGGIYALYRLDENRLNYLWAILLLSVATLTKGPVGSLLPCLAMGLYFLLRGDNFWRTLLKLCAVCVASFVIPALWYWAAWHQGGKEFLDLAMEENVGRLTGTMSYESHVNPWWYNILTILAGMLPWTIFVIVGLCYRRIRRAIRTLKFDRGLPLMAWTVALTIFIFYCIPASKRSVYLLPMYPFMAYGAAWTIGKMRDTHFMHVSANVLAAIAVVAPIVMMILTLTPARVPLEPMPWWRLPFGLIPVVTGLWWLLTRKRSSNAVSGIVLSVYALLLSYHAVFAPMVLNPKSDIRAAETIAAKVPADEQQYVWSVIPDDLLMRYYTINYYLHDRMRRAPSFDSVPVGQWVIAPVVPEGVQADTIKRRSCDNRKPIVMFRKGGM